MRSLLGTPLAMLIAACGMAMHGAPTELPTAATSGLATPKAEAPPIAKPVRALECSGVHVVGLERLPPEVAEQALRIVCAIDEMPGITKEREVVEVNAILDLTAYFRLGTPPNCEVATYHWYVPEDMPDAPNSSLERDPGCALPGSDDLQVPEGFRDAVDARLQRASERLNVAPESFAKPRVLYMIQWINRSTLGTRCDLSIGRATVGPDWDDPAALEWLVRKPKLPERCVPTQHGLEVQRALAAQGLPPDAATLAAVPETFRDAFSEWWQRLPPATSGRERKVVSVNRGTGSSIHLDVETRDHSLHACKRRFDQVQLWNDGHSIPIIYAVMGACDGYPPTDPDGFMLELMDAIAARDGDALSKLIHPSLGLRYDRCIACDKPYEELFSRDRAKDGVRRLEGFDVGEFECDPITENAGERRFMCETAGGWNKYEWLLEGDRAFLLSVSENGD
jgi:hypothetical protein